MEKTVNLQLATAFITVPEAKAPEWEAKGWKRVETRVPYVEPPLEVGKAVQE